MVRRAWVGLFVLLAGCAVSPDEDEDVDESADAIRNTPISETKLCVRVKRDTTLFLEPTGGATIKTKNANGARLTTSGGSPRYVLVQRKPGRVNGRVWVDPDLFGLRSEDERDALAKRCGISKAAAGKAVKTAQSNEYQRRGWVDVDDLTGNLRGVLDADMPNGTSGAVTDGKLRTIKAQCLIQGAYRGSSNTRASGLATYGTCADWKSLPNGDVACTTWSNALYVSYGTPEIDGGGISFGYLPVGEKVHFLRSHVHEQDGDHCQVDDDAEKLRCNGDAKKPARDRRVFWAEVWSRRPGRTIKGWVPEDCLE